MRFTTSSTGALAPDYSTITLAAPVGTNFGSGGDYTVEDVTTSSQCGLDNWVTSNGGATVTLTIAGGCTIAAGDSVLVTASEVSNPATTSTGDTVAVSTSSDTLSAHTNTYAITAAQSVASPSVTLSTYVPGATGVTYDLQFATSSTGAPSRTPGRSPWPRRQAPTSAPAARTLSRTSRRGRSAGRTPWATSNGGATVTLTVAGGCAIAAGDTLLVSASAVSNPATAPRRATS